MTNAGEKRPFRPSLVVAVRHKAFNLPDSIMRIGLAQINTIVGDLAGKVRGVRRNHPLQPGGAGAALFDGVW